MTATASCYEFQHLGEDCFRVLDILTTSPIITTRLTPVNDDEGESANYTALSYAWGQQPASESILCEGKLMAVSPHLYEGLERVAASSECQRLWVDALCINQNDDSEKAIQVGKMGEIFKKAAKVVVWLGSAADDSDQVMVAMNGLRDRLPSMPTVNNDTELLERVVKLKSTSVRLFDIALFKGVASLSRREWFQRLWIVQEYFHGRSVWFFCGPHVIDDPTFTEILRKLSIYVFGDQEPSGFQEEANLFEGFGKFLAIRRLKDGDNSLDKLSFYNLVIEGRRRECKEPVDRIYAAFGMAPETEITYKPKIPIDYSNENRTSYWKLYSLFGKLALVNEPHLRLLSVTSSDKRPPMLPSWCPNLDSKSETSVLSEVYAAGWPFEVSGGADTATLVRSDRCPHFKSKTEGHVDISLSNDLIAIWGATLDRVSAVGQTCDWDSSIPTEDLINAQPLAKQYLAWMHSCINLCFEVLGDRELARWVWGQIVVGGNKRAQSAKTADELKEGTKVEEFVEFVLLQIIALDTETATREQYPKLHEHFEALSIYMSFTEDLWTSRVLFATVGGRLGFGSERIVKDDAVCMFYSGRTMYILRQSPHKSTADFVSDAYVFDHMNGETFELLDKGILKEERFVIS